MTITDIQIQILLCQGALGALYDLGTHAYATGNEELQVVLMERISSKKGEKARLKIQLRELTEKQKVAA